MMTISTYLNSTIWTEDTLQATMKASGVPCNSLKVNLILMNLIMHDSRLDLFQKCKSWI